MITASAASEEAVAPASPIAIPTSAQRQRRRVVDAVADHHHRRAGRPGADRPARPRACPAACSRRRPDRARAPRRPARRSRGVVTGDHRDVPRRRRPAARSTSRRGVVADVVGHHDRARPARPSTSPRSAPARCSRASVARRRRRRPSATRRCPSTRALDPVARLLAHVLGERAARALRRGRRARARRRAHGPTADPATPPGAATRSLACRRDGLDPDDPRRAEGQRAGLVEQHAACAAEPLDHARALDDDPGRAARETPETSAIGAARISGHGVATTTTASARTASPASCPGGRGDHERHGQQQRRVAIGHARERRAIGLRPARTRLTSAA